MKRTLLFLFLLTSFVYPQWQLRNNGLPAGYIGAMDAYDQNHAVAASGSIYYTSNGGVNWSAIYSGLVHDISMVNTATFVAVTDSTIIRTTNAGSTWQTVFTHTPFRGIFNYIKAFGNTIVAMADCDGNVSGSRAGIYRSTDAGATWIQVNQNYLQDCWSMDVWRKFDFGTSDNGIFFYSISGPAQRSVARSADGGISWATAPLGENNYIHSLRMYNAGYGIGAGNDEGGGAVFVTRDGGATWQKFINRSNIQSSVAFVKNRPAEIFLGCTGQLWYSADSGRTWSRQNFDNVRITDIVFTSETNGWLCTSTGQVYWTDNKGTATVSAKQENKTPSEYRLEQNYPNPFNPSTKINFSIQEPSFVSLKVYDMLGREIKTLIGENQSAGNHSAFWNGDDSFGNKVAAGIYLYSIRAGAFSFTRKMLLIK